jgi:hypothetical protein
VRLARTSLYPTAVTRILGAIALMLIIASTAGQLMKYLAGQERIYGLVPLFYLSGEGNIPTLFSTLLLVSAAMLFALNSSIEKNQATRYYRAWTVLSAGFLFMAVDEATVLHERLIPGMRALLGGGELGYLYFAWVVPYGLVVLLLVPFLIRFVLRLPRVTRLHLLVAAALYLGGALGVELIGGNFAEQYGRQHLAYSMITTVEETLEIAGLIVLIRGLLTHLATQYGELRLSFDPSSRHKAEEPAAGPTAA